MNDLMINYLHQIASKHNENKNRELRAIVACDKTGLIGIGNKLPWKCKPDLANFKKLTDGHLLVFGMNTYRALCNTWPTDVILPNRDIVVLYTPQDSSALQIANGKSNVLALPLSVNKRFGGRVYPLPMLPISTSKVLNDMSTLCLLQSIYANAKDNQKVFIAGGAKTYEMFLPYIIHYDVSLIKHNNEMTALEENYAVYLHSGTEQKLKFVLDEALCEHLQPICSGVDSDNDTSYKYFVGTVNQ